MNFLRAFILVCLLALVGCAPQATQAPTTEPEPEPTQAEQVETQPIRILRLDSNHAEFPWSQQIRLGVIEGLKENGFDVESDNVMFDEFYLDTKRNTTEEYYEEISEEAIALIRETKPDIVIVNDDTATRLVVQPLRNEGIHFVLLGLNGKPEDYELDGSENVAGVLERPHVAEMMNWIEQVFGEDQRISILAEDSPTSDRMFGDGSIQEGIKASGVELVDETFTNDYDAWQEYVQSVDDTSDILFLGAYASLRTEEDEAVEAVEALRWTVSNSPVPVMGFWEEAVHDGTLGGTVISGSTQGYEAGVRAAEILNGTPPIEIGFSVPPRGKLIVNSNAMEQWHVEVPLSLLEVSQVVEQ